MTCTVRPISAAAAFCCGTGALGALAAAGPASAAPNPAPKAKAAPAPRLPARGNFVIRNAYVMTMERDAGDVANGDVHVRDGAIVAVGPEAQRAGRGGDQRRRHDRAAGPGRDALAHVEFAACAACRARKPSSAISAPRRRSARNTSRTTCIRARGSRPPKRSIPASPSCTTGATTSAASIMPRPICARCRKPGCARVSPMVRAGHAEQRGHQSRRSRKRLHGDWAAHSNDGLITLGLAWRGMGGNNPADRHSAGNLQGARSKPPASSACRSRSTPAARDPAVGQIGTIGKAGLLGSDMQIIHAVVATKPTRSRR